MNNPNKPTHYGNSSFYIAARLKRDRPDIAERTANGEFPSMRAAGIEAGINVDRTPPDDKHLVRLFKAWLAADDVSRALFLEWAGDDAIKPLHRGPKPSVMADSAPPELKALADRMTMADLARHLDVSRETVRRWCAGASQIRPKTLERMRALIDAA